MATENFRHWSQDFVEHLRSVHFALIAVSAGLVLLIASSNIYEPGRALAELESIMDLRQRWDFEEILLASTKQPRDEAEYESMMRNPPSFVCTVYDQDQSGSSNPKMTVLGSPFICHIQNKWAPTQSREFLSEYITKPPDDLREFYIWWEKHQDPRKFAYLASIRLMGGVGISEGADTDLFANGSAPPLKKVEVQSLDRVSKKPERVVELSLSRVAHEGEGKDSWSIEGLDTVSANMISFEVDVVTATLDQSTFITTVSPNCKEFKDCFPELWKASKGLESVALEELHAHLAQQLDKGSEVFEAVGLKIPLEQLVFWGMLIPLSIQTYFLLHLKELRAKIQPTDSGWSVAWIGIYNSQRSRIAFFLTTCVLPIIAAVLLLLQAIASVRDSQVNLWRGDGLKLILALVYSVLACALCVLVASLTWNHRPVLAKAK